MSDNRKGEAWASSLITQLGAVIGAFSIVHFYLRKTLRFHVDAGIVIDSNNCA
ncbi:MAG: hypothetical protein QMB87_11710 [Flavobacteriales bacterium]